MCVFAGSLGPTLWRRQYWKRIGMGSHIGGSALWAPRTRIVRGSAPNTLAGSATNQIRHDIISGRLRPGARLYFEKITKAYGMGVSPLREALVQLTADGLVVNEGHKGFSVAPILLDEMLDVAELRIQLESLALRKSIARGDEEWEIGVVAAHLRLTRATRNLETRDAQDRDAAEDNWENRHREFHFALTAACESHWLLHFCDRLYDQIERYRRHFWEYADRARRTGSEHDSLKDAAIERNADLAVDLLEQHFRNQAELTADVMRQHGETSDPVRDGSARP